MAHELELAYGGACGGEGYHRDPDEDPSEGGCDCDYLDLTVCSCGHDAFDHSGEWPQVGEGWSRGLQLSDAAAIDLLVDFVRTPEWSVSMLEDIADIVRRARPNIGEDYDEDDERAWVSH